MWYDGIIGIDLLRGNYVWLGCNRFTFSFKRRKGPIFIHVPVTFGLFPNGSNRKVWKASVRVALEKSAPVSVSCRLSYTLTLLGKTKATKLPVQISWLHQQHVVQWTHQLAASNHSKTKQPKKLEREHALIHPMWFIDAFTPTVWAFFPQDSPNETQVVSAFQDLMAANRAEPALPVEPWEPALGINKGTKGFRQFS